MRERVLPLLPLLLAHLCAFSGFLCFVCSMASDRACFGTNVNISCFDCESDENPYCRDPFNSSMANSVGIFAKPCKGCCVKFITDSNGSSSHLTYIRTCTTKPRITIDSMLIARVCMQQHGKEETGKLCICEDSLCNSATSTRGINLRAKFEFQNIPANFHFYYILTSLIPLLNMFSGIPL